MTNPGRTSKGKDIRSDRRNALKISILAIMAVGVLSVTILASETASADTIIKVGDWYINEDTTLHDGRWLVNGTVFVSNCTLTLDLAQVVFTSASSDRNGIRVAGTGRLMAIDSRIDGDAMGAWLEIMGDTLIENTTITNMDRDYRGCGIYHVGGELQVYNSTFEYGIIHIWSQSNLTVRSCSFSNFKKRAIDWSFPDVTTRRTVTIEGSKFQNKIIEGTAILVLGSSDYSYVKAHIMNNTFIDIFQCIECSRFLSWGFGNIRSLSIEGNSAFGCYRGMNIGGSSSIMVRGNTWNMRYSQSNILNIGIVGDGCPSVSDEIIRGGRTGVRISGSDRNFEIRNFTITDVDTGIMATDLNVFIYNSSIDSNIHDFHLATNANIYLHGCQHNYSAWVHGTGEILELTEINITSVTWQEGTPIDEGIVVLETEVGFQLAERNNTMPSPVALPIWIRRETLDLRVGNVRGAYKQRDHIFYSEPFSVKEIESMALVIYDRFTPMLEVDSPIDGARIREGKLLVYGSCIEQGAGIETIKVRCSGSDWNEAKLLANGRWYLTLANLSDGVVTVSVNATDRADNSMQVEVGNITIDTVAPPIEVLAPSTHVRAPLVELLVRTEPGSTAHVDDLPMEVSEEGIISTLVHLFEGENGILITVEDFVGNRNGTVYVVFLDTVAPTLRLSSPGEGGWTRDETIWMNGTTEPDARVSVNGESVNVSFGAFSVPLILEEGEATVIVTAVDLAGNVATLTRTVRVDRTSPVLEVLEPGDGHITSGRVLTVVGNTTDGSPVVVLVQGCPAAMVSTKWVKVVLLTEGPNGIEVIAVDAAGNTATSQIEVRLDTWPPLLEVTVTVGGRSFGVDDGAIITNLTEASFEIHADEAGTVEVVDREVLPMASSNLTTMFSLKEGVNGFAFVMVDDAGNKANPLVFSIERDTVPPELTITFPLDGLVTEQRYVLVCGMTETDCEMFVAGIRARILGDGSFETIVLLKAGTNSILIEVRDAAGNFMSKSINVIFEEQKETKQTENDSHLYLGLFGLIIGVVLGIAIPQLLRLYRTGKGQA